jgi:hypothetical protein
MAQKLLFISFISSFLIINLNTYSQIKQVIKVSGTFIDFNKAVDKKNGSEAVEFVSQSTKKTFASVYEYVKSKSNTNNDSIFTVNKDLILWLNKSLLGISIENIKEDEFLSFIISNGTFQKLLLNRFHVGSVSINSDNANTMLTTFSDNDKAECQFVKEGKSWKIKLESILSYLINKLP